MTLIVENGTGLSNAESYCSVAAADAHFANKGFALWDSDMTDMEKEQALRRATQFMEQHYRARWKGTKLLRAQTLSWPRYGAEADGWPIDSTVVPAEVVTACAELAYRAAQGDLNPDTTRGIVREKIGPIETEFDRYSPQNTQYPAVSMLLSAFLKGGGVNAVLVRA